MENASKALIMAGGILIALMILGALLLMFNNLSSYQNTETQTTREAQIVDFNNQYTTYDRNDVRGSDIYSLLNKVVNYNERKSSTGKEGSDIAYEPMTVNVDLKSVNSLSADGNRNRLFTVSTYTENNSTSNFQEKIVNETSRLENKYGKDIIAKLSSNTTAIFNATTNQIGLDKYNSIATNNKEQKYESLVSNRQNDIYKYYEFTQFKRAYFNCTNREYNSKTGRITKLEFEFNGKFN